MKENVSGCVGVFSENSV